MRVAFFSFFVFLLGIAFFVVGVVYLLAKSFFSVSIRSGSRQWDASLARLRAKLGAERPTLLRWDAEALNLLSLHRHADQKRNWWMSSDISGSFLTIYQEPVAAFAQTRQGRYALAVVQTSDSEYIFQQKEKETDVWRNGTPYGVLVGGSLLAAGRDSRLLAQMDLAASAKQIPVVLGSQTAATLANPTAEHSSPYPRAVMVLRDLSADEQTALLVCCCALQLRQIR
jgi:hypothetical protein